MKITMGGASYTPGTYARGRSSAAELADRYIREWDERRIAKTAVRTQLFPTICFSRKIGVGALEVADVLAEMIGYRVVDREILEHIAGEAKLSEKTVAMFDERYPGKLNEFLALAFGEKAFIKSDYAKHLFNAIYSIAWLEPTIFVGRGAHLLLPRDRTLAVRFIGSKAHRVKRLAGILKVEEKDVERKLSDIDSEQRDFFKRVYGKKDARLEEFDMGINLEYIADPTCAAIIVIQACKEKFGSEFQVRTS